MSESKQSGVSDVENRDKELSSIDRLFRDVKRYRKSSEFQKKLDFYSKFPYLGVYNAELVDQQRPGARLVLTAKKWEKLYERKIKPKARPVIVLVPFYPVEFLFDISDTIPINKQGKESNEVIENIIDFHKASCEHDLSFYFNRLEENLGKYGIFYNQFVTGSEILAEIAEDRTETLDIKIAKGHYVRHNNYFTICVDWRANKATRLASIIHELGHLFCQHIGCSWWDERSDISKETREFEAETVSYLVCERLGISTRSAEYLAIYFNDNEDIPDISIDMVFRAVDIVQQIVSGYVDVTHGFLYKKDPLFKEKVNKEKERIKEEKEKEKALLQHR